MPSKIILDEIDAQITGNEIVVSNNIILDCSKISNYIILPQGRSVERENISGNFRWNTTTERAEVYNGTAWLELALQEEYDLVTKAGLIFYIDAADEFSYPGLGDNVTNLAKTYFVTCFLRNNTLYDVTEKAFSFDATSTYAEISNNLVTNPACLRAGDGMTISIWFKSNPNLNYDTGLNSKILFAMNSSGNVLRLGVAPDAGGGIFVSESIDERFGSVNYNDNQWHEFSYVLEPGTSARNAYIYVDNVLIGTKTDANPDFTSATAISLGMELDETSVSDVFGGYISIVTIFNRNLSSSELTQNYNAFKNRYGL